MLQMSSKTSSLHFYWTFLLCCSLHLLAVQCLSTQVSLHPTGTYMASYYDEVIFTCVLSRNQGQVLNWNINGQPYYSVNTLPPGFQHSFTNTTAAQLRIPSLTLDLNSAMIKCFITVDGQDIFTKTLHIIAIGSPDTTASSTAPTTTPNTPASTSDDGGSEPSQSPSAGSHNSSSGLRVHVSVFVVAVSVISTLLWYFSQSHSYS